ncbi:MAG: site-specific integrase [Opitutaceae bacterium]|nr:site-specific integrase [Opitutaceae bacterium]
MIIDLASLAPQQWVCPPGQRRIEYVDKGGIGLYLELRMSSPIGTYYLRYKNAQGKTCHQKIGSSAVLTVAEARREAKRIKAEITLGADPRAEAAAKRAVPTLAEFFQNHYLPHVKPRKRSWMRDDQLFNPRIKDALGSTRLDRVTRQEIQRLHTKLLEEGLAPATANHHVRLIKHCYYLAMEWGMADRNPAARMALFHEDNTVENYLGDQELAHLLKILRTDSNVAVCRVALFLLSTGCRVGEALRAKWSDVDIERRLFVISATNSKSRKLRSVPLNDTAIEVLQALPKGGESEFVFVNPETNKPFTDIRWSWVRLRKRAGFPNLRLHDLRHQYASLLVNGGRSLYEVQQILGHSDPKVTMRYAHLSTKALLDAANSASEKLRRTEVATGE